MGQAQGQLPVGAFVGEYQITGLLGEGGMGVVYAGVHPVIGKDVAIKVLSPSVANTPGIVGRFIQEARAVNQIGHPNIIDIFAFGESPELGHYFVMPRLEGEDLRQRVKRTGPVPLPEAIQITEQICDALEAAHEKNIFHRDLKPDNVFLVPRRRGGTTVKVLDFGIAKLSEGESMTVTRTGAPMGTPLFMSPEQWEADGIDHRTDIYALGVLFQYMITGRYPFESGSPVALMRMHCDQAPHLPSAYGAPVEMDPPVARALAKRPEDRFSRSGEFSVAVTTAASGIGLSRPTTSGTHASAPVASASQVASMQFSALHSATQDKKRIWPWLAAVALVIAAAVVTLVLAGGTGAGEADSANESVGANSDQPANPATLPPASASSADAGAGPGFKAAIDADRASATAAPEKKPSERGAKKPTHTTTSDTKKPTRTTKRDTKEPARTTKRDTNKPARTTTSDTKKPARTTKRDTKKPTRTTKPDTKKPTKDKWGNTTNPFDED